MEMAKSMYRSSISISPQMAQEEASKFINEGREDYYYICWLYPLCDEAMQDNISDLIKDNLDSLAAVDLYFVLIAGIKLYDKVIEGIFIKRLNEYPTDEVDILNDDNPLRWIIQACIDGFITINSMINYDKANDSSLVLKFINHPESFNINDFSNDWDILLHRREFIERYKLLKRNEEWKEYKEYNEFCKSLV